MALRYVAANTHPDHDTINTFRKAFWGDIESVLAQVLRMAAGMGVLKLGVVSLDGTQVKANASQRAAVSYGHAKQLETRIQAALEARATARDTQAVAEQVRRRQVLRAQGSKPRGAEPRPPSTGAKDSAQRNLTDPESRILPAGADFVQGYNAQLAVDATRCWG